MEFAWGVACVLLGYLVGSIPVGYLVARWVRGIDIRLHGSGNVGATNVGRVLGNRWGLLVLALDALKGGLPVALLPKQLLPPGAEGFLHWQVAVGVATIVGHMYPFSLGLRGGKGVATALGVVSCLAPHATLIAGGAFLICFGLCRYVSLGAMVAAAVFAITQFGKYGPQLFSGSQWSLGVFSVLVPALIILRHRSNIGRLLRGEEPKYGSRNSAADEGPGATPPTGG